MLQLGILDIAYDEGYHLKITDYGKDILRSMRTVQLSKFYFDNKYPAPERKEKSSQGRLPVDTPVSKELISKLKDLRYAIAKAQGVPPYIVFNDKVLEIMASERPVTKAHFATLYGVGERKTEMYWRQFTSAIAKFIKEENLQQ